MHNARAALPAGTPTRSHISGISSFRTIFLGRAYLRRVPWLSGCKQAAANAPITPTSPETGSDLKNKMAAIVYRGITRPRQSVAVRESGGSGPGKSAYRKLEITRFSRTPLPSSSPTPDQKTSPSLHALLSIRANANHSRTHAAALRTPSAANPLRPAETRDEEYRFRSTVNRACS